MARDFEDHCWKDLIDADTIQIYQAYRRRVYVGENPAVLAIDLYNKAYRGGDRPVKEVDREFSGSCGEHAWKALPPTQALFKAARRAGMPIIYTTRHLDTGGVHSTNRNIGREADDTYAIKPELAPASDELVIYKERASAFFGTSLIAHLQQKRPRHRRSAALRAARAEDSRRARSIRSQQERPCRCGARRRLARHAGASCPRRAPVPARGVARAYRRACRRAQSRVKTALAPSQAGAIGEKA